MTIPINSKKIQCQIVTYNNGATIEKCLESILASKFIALVASFVIIDNCSTDGSIERIQQKYGNDINIIRLDKNIGFAGGHNHGVRHALEQSCSFIAILNPDLILEEDCIERLANALDTQRKIGISSPKLYRTTRDFNKDFTHIDAAGMYFTKALRHLDRTEEFDKREIKPADKFENQQYAIGGSGACLVISKECVEAISFPKGILDNQQSYLFDPDFFAYREDAELALRMQWFSWKTVYVPKAIGYHKRFVRPHNRTLIPTKLNRMSVRNRFLFQGNNISWGLFILTFPFSWLRNVLVIIGCVTTERTSFPGLVEVFNLRHRTLLKRKYIFKNASTSLFSFYSLLNKNFAFSPAFESLVPENDLDNQVKTTITAIIINYHQGAEVADCYRSLLSSNLKDHNLSVKLVNNSPKDQEFLTFKESMQLSNDSGLKIEFIETGENLGFAGAINRAVAGDESDYFLILNPDITLDKNTINSNLDQFHKYSNLAAISPILIDRQTREPQITYSVKRFPRLITLLAEIPGIKVIFPHNQICKFQHYQDNLEILNGFKNRSGCYEVEQLAGACLMIRKSAFKKVGGFNEEFHPAWHEDVDFAMELFKNGLPSAINCEAQVYHTGGTSTSNLGRSKFLFIYYKNYLKLWSRHNTGLTELTGKLIISISFIIKKTANFDTNNVIASIKDIFKETCLLWRKD